MNGVIILPRIIIDAGHGGSDSGAVYNGRKEKDDNLSLALAVGGILEDKGYDVVYTRTDDIYQTPIEKARTANNLGGDFFISFHRNASPNPNTYSGVETLVYNLGDQKEVMANNINSQLEKTGYRNLGISVRPNLAVLRRTQMPAVLIETGFLNTDADNTRFDSEFTNIAVAIANGIMETVPLAQGSSASMGSRGVESGMTGGTSGGMDSGTGGNMTGGNAPVYSHYRIQTGLFRDYRNAVNLQYELIRDGYSPDIVCLGEYYAVITGHFSSLENAQAAAKALNQKGFETLVIKVE